MAKIIVNAVAISGGGGLTILKQFISNIPLGDEYFVFIGEVEILDLLPQKENVYFVLMKKKKWINRLVWDYFGLVYYSFINGISADLVISLQNTPIGGFFRTPQIVYLHQAIPIVNYKWRFYSSSEFKYWFYKKIYPYLIRGFFINNKYYVCQAEWMREKYSKLLKFPLGRIYKFSPDFRNYFNNVKLDLIDSGRVFFIYPAQYYPYKNHLVLIDAVKNIKLQDVIAYSKIQILLTLDVDECHELLDYMKRCQVEDSFIYTGNLSYDEVMSIFENEKSILLFPSEIETIGMPLLEAASFGKPIIVSDLPYAREVLDGYDGVKYVSPHNSDEWSREMMCIYSNFKKYDKFLSIGNNGWKDFFALAKNVICK